MENYEKKAHELFNGYYIVFEGIEGCGKDTQINLLERDFQFVRTFEPGNTERGEIIRDLLLNKKYGNLNPIAELSLFLADRREHFDKLVIPALKKGKIVVSARNGFSSWAYQGYARGLNKKFENEFPKRFRDFITYQNHLATEYNGYSIIPDLCIFLDVDPKLGLSRKKEKDRIEDESIAFMEKAREGYLKLTKLYDIKIVDGNRSIEEIYNDILKLVKETLN